MTEQQLVEAIARRVVELLDDREQRPHSLQPGQPVDARTLAPILGLARSTVYEHADELGGVRLGDGKRARLRFDVEQAVAAWTRRVSRERSNGDLPQPAGTVRRRGRGATRSADGLLPIRRQAPP